MEVDQADWEIVFVLERVVVVDELRGLEWQRFAQIEMFLIREDHLFVSFHHRWSLWQNYFDFADALDALVRLPRHRLSVQYDGDWSDQPHCHARQTRDNEERLDISPIESFLPSQT